VGFIFCSRALALVGFYAIRRINQSCLNRNWEQLVRLLFGKPLHQKPPIGKAPSYITGDSDAVGNQAAGRLSLLRQAILEKKVGLALYRADFINSCIEAADKLRVRVQPSAESFAQKIADDFASLSSLRNQLIDWILLESRANTSQEFSEALHELLERVCHLRDAPPEVSSYNQAWFEAHRVFVYEFFLYVVAALLKTNSWQALHLVFSNRYLIAQPHTSPELATFQTFWGYAEHVAPAITPPGRRLKSPAAQLIKLNANRDDLPFNAIMQAELLTLLMSFVSGVRYWYPQTLYYLGHGATFPLFIRAAQRRHFANLAIITGVKTGVKGDFHVRF
jgi:hypothetical protein